MHFSIFRCKTWFLAIQGLPRSIFSSYDLFCHILWIKSNVDESNLETVYLMSQKFQVLHVSMYMEPFLQIYGMHSWLHITGLSSCSWYGCMYSIYNWVHVVSARITGMHFFQLFPLIFWVTLPLPCFCIWNYRCYIEFYVPNLIFLVYHTDNLLCLYHLFYSIWLIMII